MTLELIRTYYSFNAWANDRILDSAATLTLDQYLANSNPSFGSVHNTLVHIMSAQWVWLSRWIGSYPKTHLDPNSFPDLSAIRTHWNAIENNSQEFVSQCTEEDVTGLWTYINSRDERQTYPLWQLMLHQVNHATQHRSEIAMVLTCFNHSPGDLDFRTFIDTQPL
jgi:uncharacterized damage-inducible protein DinB